MELEVNGFSSPMQEIIEKNKALKNTKSVDISSSNLEDIPDDVLSDGDSVSEFYADFNLLTEIPKKLIDSLQYLQVLSANGNGLKRLSNSIGLLVDLKQLELVENELLSIPSSLCDLHCLQTLKLTGNKLKSLPENFGNLKSLKVLSVEENALKILPSTLGNLSNLTVLEACNNQLNGLPDSIGNLTNLSVFNVSHNKISTIPLSFEKLQKLEHLDVSVNGIEYLPEKCSSTKTLKKFFAECNLLKSLPKWVNHLPEVTNFSVRENQLPTQQLTEDFGRSNSKLRSLDISGNFMTQLPVSIGDLHQLEEFHMGSVIDELERRNFQNGNWIAHLPESFSQLSCLREIHLDENQLVDLPQNFGELQQLEILDIGQNMITALPDSFCDLKNLRVCQLSKNSIKQLPENFGNLCSLEDLRLDSNQLTELPKSFEKLTQLKSLDLFQNKLTEIPVALNSIKNLIRLDLGENNFKIPWHKVPNLIMKNQYAPRNPELKDNWRGRARLGVDTNGDTREPAVVAPVDVPDEDAETDSDTDVPYSHDVMRRAAERNLSFWRSHEGPQTRQLYKKPEPWTPLPTPKIEEDDGWESDKNVENGKDGSSCEESCSSEEEEEDSEFDNTVTDSPIGQFTPEEDWDEEIDNELGPYEEIAVYKHPPRDRFIICHDVMNHYFRAWDIHAKPINWYDNMPDSNIEDGQFEDCEDD